MTNPGFEKYMLPILYILSDGKEHDRSSIKENAADLLKLDDKVRSEVISSGQAVYSNRAGWAISYLRQAGLIANPRRATYVITPRGRDLLAKNPPELTVKDLEIYPEYLNFKQRHKKKVQNSSVSEESDDKSGDKTPLEIINSNADEIKANICDELLDKVINNTPKFFENLVVSLVVAMGYGGSIPEAGKAIGRPGDGGIDGIVKQDKLGLDNIYIQAKRYNQGDVVQRPAVQAFAGALFGKESKGARKGIFITTSSFSQGAIEYAEGIKEGKIVLIDGEELVSLMYEYNIGVTLDTKIEIKKIDSDFFEEV